VLLVFGAPCQLRSLGCACEWGGWGRLSDDGPGHYNPDLSEGPWGGGVMILHGSAQSSLRPDTVRDNRCVYEVHEERMQTGYRMAYAGSRLKPLTHPGRHRLESQPSSRTGENPPYGMIGGIEETSASFKARSAPRSYPTSISCRWRCNGHPAMRAISFGQWSLSKRAIRIWCGTVITEVSSGPTGVEARRTGLI
jgi:hypothetical protein